MRASPSSPLSTFRTEKLATCWRRGSGFGSGVAVKWQWSGSGFGSGVAVSGSGVAVAWQCETLASTFLLPKNFM